MSIELSGIPESLGTTKCYHCHREPTQEEINKSGEQDLAPFWETFIDYYGEQKSVPVCDECMIEHYGQGGGLKSDE